MKKFRKIRNKNYHGQMFENAIVNGTVYTASNTAGAVSGGIPSVSVTNSVGITTGTTSTGSSSVGSGPWGTGTTMNPTIYSTKLPYWSSATTIARISASSFLINGSDRELAINLERLGVAGDFLSAVDYYKGIETLELAKDSLARILSLVDTTSKDVANGKQLKECHKILKAKVKNAPSCPALLEESESYCIGQWYATGVRKTYAPQDPVLVAVTGRTLDPRILFMLDAKGTKAVHGQKSLKLVPRWLAEMLSKNPATPQCILVEDVYLLSVLETAICLWTPSKPKSEFRNFLSALNTALLLE
jgi:hypothetical protein